MGFAGPVYGAFAAVLGVVFFALSLDVLRQSEGAAGRQAAIRLFLYSIFHLFALYAVLLIEHFARMIALGS